jgi:hypothetical protein
MVTLKINAALRFQVTKNFIGNLIDLVHTRFLNPPRVLAQRNTHIANARPTLAEINITSSRRVPPESDCGWQFAI